MQKLMSKQEMITMTKRHSPSFNKQTKGPMFAITHSSESKESVDKISVGDEN